MYTDRLRPFRFLKPERSFIFLAILIFIGCSPTEPSADEIVVDEPSAIPTEAIQPTAAPLASATAVNTLPPPVISEPATPTAIPTVELPEPTETVAPTTTIEPTLTVEAEPTLEGGCRPLDQTLQYKNPFVVTENLPPHTALSTEVIGGFSNGLKIIHLGFDVEGSAEVMGPLLEVLDRRQVKATMFILGSWAEIYPNWVTEMGLRGHEFANHTWSHGNIVMMDAATVKKELADTEAIVQRLTGKSTKPFMRPPFGSRSAVSIQAAFEEGYSTIIWTGSTEDWREGATAETMCRTLLLGSFPGGILYSHTWHPEMPETIDRYIGELQAQGYTFVPMSVIMSGNPQDYLIPNN